MVEGLARGVKYAMFVSNAIICIGGIVVFSIGVWTLSDKSFMERLLGTNLYVASAIILIATGIIVSIISFLGTMGAYKEVKCILLTFFVILFMIFITMMVGGVMGYVFRSEVDERMHTEMFMSMASYGNDTKVTEAWDAVQRTFNCCGIFLPSHPNKKSWEAWEQTLENTPESTKRRIPKSCCRDVDEKICPGKNIISSNIFTEVLTGANLFTEGCYDKIKDFVKGHALIVGGIGIGIACLLVFGMALSCALFLMIK